MLRPLLRLESRITDTLTSYGGPERMEELMFKVTVRGHMLNTENVRKFIQGALEVALDGDAGDDASVLVGEPLGVESVATES